MSSHEAHTDRTFRSDLRHLSSSGIVYSLGSRIGFYHLPLDTLNCIIQQVGPQEGYRLNGGTGWFEVRKESDRD